MRKQTPPQPPIETAFARLSADYPWLFDPDDPKPLKIGIHEDLHKVYWSRLGKDKRKKFLRFWTHQESYKKALEHYVFRFDLDGNLCPMERGGFPPPTPNSIAQEAIKDFPE